MNIQDPKGNTALHYCVAFNNMTVMQILLNRGASLDIKNNKNLTSLELAIDRNKANLAAFIRANTDTDKEKMPGMLRSLSANKDLRTFFTRFYPFFIMFYFGFFFQSDMRYSYKALFFAFLYPISFTFQK
jgi:hypothetical protein